MSRIDTAPTTSTSLDGLRTNAFAAVTMLLIEFGLGLVVSLYAKLPSSDSRKGLFSAFGAAVASGPVALTLHALLGTLLLVTATAAVVRAVRVRRNAAIAITSVAFLAIILAWLAGTRFVGDADNGPSLVMGLATGVAILCYSAILFNVSDG